jgi:hypothetical protein
MTTPDPRQIGCGGWTPPSQSAEEKAKELLARMDYSDLIEVRMRGGTIIRIPAGRGDGMPYDLLIEALKVCKHWDDDEEEWRDGDPFVYLEVIHGQNAGSDAPGATEPKLK